MTERLTLPLRGSAASECEPCADRLSDRLRELPGIHEVRVDSATSTLRVQFNATEISSVLVEREAETIAEELQDRFGHLSYRIVGMDCANCALSIEKGVASLPGIVSARVNFPASRLRIEHEAEPPVHAVEKRVRDLGFSLLPEQSANAASSSNSASNDTGQQQRRHDFIRICGAGFLLVAGLFLERVIHSPIAAEFAFGLCTLLGGYRFALAGIRALKARSVGTHLLMALAAVGAVALGQWFEAAAVVFLYSLGETLESAAMDRTRRSLSSLIEAAPRDAILIQQDGSHETVSLTAITVGDILLVKPGAKIAADGTIVSGQSAVAEAAITGESVPRDKQPGDLVYAGSVNSNGTLHVRVTALPSDSTLARILHLVEEAQAQKAPTQALVERFGAIYTPLVLMVAVALAVGGTLLAPGGEWLHRALTLLVVACPCALIIATPVAYVSGIARAARAGILFKGGIHLEALASARHIALDKTGTLTTGQMQVTDLFPGEGVSETQLLGVTAAVEAFSDHPIARAVVAAARARELCPLPATDAATVPGRGVTARIESQTVLAGTAALLETAGVAMPELLKKEGARLEQAGRTTLYAARGEQVLGIIAVGDMPRPEAAAVLRRLKQFGLQAAMLTGDSETVARTIGEAVGITRVYANLLPQDKLAAVRQSAETGSTIFVGDGINDAPALAAATVGVAMGAGGTAAALEAADVALMHDDLTRLPLAIQLARATRSVVRQNVVIALGTVMLLLVSTFAGKLSLPVGVLGHEASALLVILNALRLLSPRLTRLT